MGENKVIHLTFPSPTRWAPNPTPMNIILARCPACEASGWRKHAKGESVIISCLDCFIGLGSLYRFEYGVGKLAYAFKLRGGTCTSEESGPVEVVMARALNLLENGFREYDLLSHNCEDFARFCKTGQDCNRNGMGGDGGSQASSLMGKVAVKSSFICDCWRTLGDIRFEPSSEACFD